MNIAARRRVGLVGERRALHIPHVAQEERLQRIYVANTGWSTMSWGTRIMAVLGVTLALALAVGFVVLSLGIALLLLPVVAVFAAIGWWRWRKMIAELRKQAQSSRADDDPTSGGFRVIEADYEVVGSDDAQRRR